MQYKILASQVTGNGNLTFKKDEIVDGSRLNQAHIKSLIDAKAIELITVVPIKTVMPEAENQPKND